MRYIMLLLLISSRASALTMEWVLPTENIDGSPVGTIEKSTVYCNGIKLLDVAGSTNRLDNPPDCPGYLYAVTVTANGNESAPSSRVLLYKCPEPLPITYSVKPYIRSGISYDRKLYLFMADGTTIYTGKRAAAGTPCEGPNLNPSTTSSVLYMQVTGYVGAAVCQEDQ